MPACIQNRNHKIESRPLPFSEYHLNNFGEYENKQSEKFYFLKDEKFIRIYSLITPDNCCKFYYSSTTANNTFTFVRTFDVNNIEII